MSFATDGFSVMQSAFDTLLPTIYGWIGNEVAASATASSVAHPTPMTQTRRSERPLSLADFGKNVLMSKKRPDDLAWGRMEPLE